MVVPGHIAIFLFNNRITHSVNGRRSPESALSENHPLLYIIINFTSASSSSLHTNGEMSSNDQMSNGDLPVAKAEVTAKGTTGERHDVMIPTG